MGVLTLQVSAERRAYFAEWRSRHRHEAIVYAHDYREKNKEALEVKSKVRRLKNKAHKARYDAVYFAANPPDKAKVRAKSHKWYICNKAKAFAYCRAYQTRKLQRSAAWADDDAIKFFYEFCPKGCEVDHIIPLQGENISGLHIETNLQWMTAQQNASKSNRWGGSHA